MLKMSVAGVSRRRRGCPRRTLSISSNCSGEAYCLEAPRIPAPVSPGTAILKSIRQISPVLVTMILAGLMSLWMMGGLWACR